MVPLWLIAVLCLLAGIPLAYKILMPFLRREIARDWAEEHQYDGVQVEMSERLKLKLTLLCHGLCVLWPLAVVAFVLCALVWAYEHTPGFNVRRPSSRATA